MQPEVIHRITSGVSALVLCASLAVGSMAFSSGAQAQVKGSLSAEQPQVCTWMQDQFDGWSGVYAADEAGSPEEQEALDNMRGLETNWYEAGCDHDFGAISTNHMPVKQSNVGLVLTNAR